MATAKNDTKNGKSPKRVAYEAMLAIEAECKAELEKLEKAAEPIREKRNAAVLGWLQEYGVKGKTKVKEKVEREDGTFEERTIEVVTYTHAPQRIDGVDTQAVYKRSKGGKPIAFVKRPGAAEEMA